MPSSRDALDARIARIHKLLRDMRDTAADAREEALVATEQLLLMARKGHEDTIKESRAILRAVERDRAERKKQSRKA